MQAIPPKFAEASTFGPGPAKIAKQKRNGELVAAVDQVVYKWGLPAGDR